jgi:hypothetical protein
VTGKYLSNWKIAKVIALHKKGDKKSLKKLQASFATGSCRKDSRKVVALQIEEYFEKNNLFGNFYLDFEGITWQSLYINKKL